MLHCVHDLLQDRRNIPASHTSPSPLKHLSFGPHCGRAPEQTTTMRATCTSSNCIPFPISFGPTLERMITFHLALRMQSNSFTLVGQNLRSTRAHQQVSSVCARNHPAIDTILFLHPSKLLINMQTLLLTLTNYAFSS